MSMRPSLLECFQSHEFLGKLDNHCLLDLAAEAQPFTATSGEILAYAGQPAHAFYLIQSGQVDIGLDENGEYFAVHTVGPGGVIGWSWVIPPYEWQFTCRADGPVSGLKLDATWLRERCEHNHELGFHLLRALLANFIQELVVHRENFDRSEIT